MIGRFLVWLKTIVALHTLVIEFCHDCGCTQPVVWTATDAVWAEFADGQHPLCPDCFDARATKRGVMLRWTPIVEHRRHEAPYGRFDHGALVGMPIPAPPRPPRNEDPGVPLRNV